MNREIPENARFHHSQKTTQWLQENKIKTPFENTEGPHPENVLWLKIL